jgi:RND family efflux transporter MFP subunit
VLIAGALGALLYSLFSASPVSPETTTRRTVQTATVASLSGSVGSLSVVGELRAVSQADLRAQKTGRVTGVYATAGRTVAAGTIIAELENASERARVLSAEGQLQAAQAQLDRLRAGARPEDRLAAETAAQSAQGALSQATISAVNAFKQGYSAAQDAISGKADSLFRDVETVNPKLLVQVQDFSTAQAIEADRVSLAKLLTQWEAELTTVTPDDARITQELVAAQERLERVRTFLDDLARVTAAQSARGVSQTTIDSQLAVISSARGAVDGGLATIAGARSSLFAAQSGKAAALAQQETIAQGARSEDISAAQASVTTARGALAGAVADLDTTRVRAPFGGTVSALSVSVGDYVVSGAPMAVITNDRGDSYVVETFINPSERPRISIGSTASIDGGATGTVTNIAPGVDQATQKIRVEIAISDLPETIAPGQSVRITIATDEDSNMQSLVVPLTALKLSPEGAYVFTVTASSTLALVPVMIGDLIGDRAVISGGVSADTKILIDARGRRDGELVTVAASAEN